MQSKEKNNKTTCTKNNSVEVPLTAQQVADLALVSKSLVDKVNTGERGAETPAGERVILVIKHWNEATRPIIKNIQKSIVKHKKYTENE